MLSAAGDIGVAVGSSVLGMVAEWFGYKVLFAAATMVVLVCTYYFYIALKGRRQATLHPSRAKDCHNA
ncbi:hypothetical protein TcarDRAFT_1084 [Thermosinus carboxydivorans Nor1]|uniref:Uncharacterized protein n=1 Tax=Thermosinus carboxydivorans Nor1 TaxID=401526 RepID=A1HQV3_9FIRM|nr:hypothetical protein TcarDRAFT_1084 [Thermosinus carboxydivorans Nor1]